MATQSHIDPISFSFEPMDFTSTPKQNEQSNDAFNHALAMFDMLDASLKSLDSSPKSSPHSTPYDSPASRSPSKTSKYPRQQLTASPTRANKSSSHKPVDLAHADWRAEKARFWDTRHGLRRPREPRRGGRGDGGRYRGYVDLDAPNAGPDGYVMPLSERPRGFGNHGPHRRPMTMINPLARFVEPYLGRRNRAAPLLQYDAPALQYGPDEECIADPVEAEPEIGGWSYEKEFAKSWLM